MAPLALIDVGHDVVVRLGGAIGVYTWARSGGGAAPPSLGEWFWIAGWAVVIGALAGLRQDAFWESIGTGLRAYNCALLIGLGLLVLGLGIYFLWLR
jgi:hypothetical protein